jgi:hypothetical protein
VIAEHDSSDEEEEKTSEIKKLQREIKLYSAFDYYKNKEKLNTIDKRIIMGTISKDPHCFVKDQ